MKNWNLPLLQYFRNCENECRNKCNKKDKSELKFKTLEAVK